MTITGHRKDGPDRADDPISLEDAVAAGAAQAWLEQLGVEVVHLGLVDTSGTLRAKRLSAVAAARAMEKGWSFIDAIQWWDPADRTWRQGGSVDQPVSVDLTSFRTYPFEANAAGLLADFDGGVGDLSPRRVLTRTIERAQRSGLVADAGWEFECIVFAGSPDPADPTSRLVPAMPSNRCWSALTMAVEADTLRALSDLLASGGIELDHVCAELGPGCLELALRPAPALRSADGAMLAKLFTKAFFLRRGQTATFMAQVAGNYPGLGGHPSLSLRSTLDGRPILEDGGGLSKLAQSGVAGVVTLLPELLVMALPNPNSYRRLAPGNWAPANANWGPGNYSCALRAVIGDPEATRLELRIPGADTTPHLCLAMLLGALTWGIEEGLLPIDPVEAPVDGRNTPGGRRLPRDLTEAAQRFAESGVARDLFGGSFVDHFTASRLAEADACRQFVSPEEQARYLHSA